MSLSWVPVPRASSRRWQLLKDAPSTTICVSWRRAFPIERRNCPKAKVGHCVGCEPCRITTGFSGAGAFSDGKLSLSHEVGGDLPELIGADVAQAAIERVDDVYLSFGADEHVEGVGQSWRSQRHSPPCDSGGSEAGRLSHSPPVEPRRRKRSTVASKTTYAMPASKLLFEAECTDVIIEGDATADSAACKGVRVRTRDGRGVRQSSPSAPSWRRAAAAPIGSSAYAPSTASSTRPDRST